MTKETTKMRPECQTSFKYRGKTSDLYYVKILSSLLFSSPIEIHIIFIILLNNLITAVKLTYCRVFK